MTRLLRLRRSIEGLFPERELSIRVGAEVRTWLLTPARQMAAAALLAGLALWTGAGTAALALNIAGRTAAEQELARTQAKYERWIADRQARLSSAVAQLDAANGSINDVALVIEKRHAALALLLNEARGAPGAVEALTPAINQALASPSTDPQRRVEMVRLSQERLLAAADSFARNRSERIRLAFRLAGLSPSGYVPKGAELGGPLIEARDPRALAAVLDVDESFARRIQRAAAGLSEARRLDAAAARMPFAQPAADARRSSGFGVRLDPFNGRPAFHSGMDFSGSVMTPIHAAGPGVVSFAGVRAGYGKTIEIDHGGGLKTRYAHLQGVGVRPGERVAVGQRIGAMGSTGRSTGPHLHYEVWVRGRAQNPDRFVKAGQHVLETDS